MRKENQIIKIQTNNPIQYFQWKQKQKQTKRASQCKWKLSFWTNKYKRNIKNLTSNQSLILNQHDTYNSSNQREEKMPVKVKRWKSSDQSKNKPRKPRSSPASKRKQKIGKPVIQRVKKT